MRRRKRARLGYIADNPNQKVFHLPSFPRSGNTMVRILLSHYFGVDARSRYAGEMGPQFSVITPNKGAEFVSVKTHDVTPGNKINPALLICRDGRDAAVSFAHYKRNFGGTRGAPPEFMRRLACAYVDPVVGASWSGFYRYWLDLYPGPVSLLRYEDVVEKPLETVGAALRKLYPDIQQVRDDPPPSFEQLHEVSARFFRRGIVGSWRSEMPTPVADLFWKHHGEMMLRLGYSEGMLA